MNDWSPWFVVGLIAMVTLILPFVYRRTRKAFLRYQGFVPLADLLGRQDVTAKEFWEQAKTRGVKVRVKHPGEAPFVNANDASNIIDSMSRPSSRGQKLTEELRFAAVTAIAAAAASSLFEESDEGPPPKIPSSPSNTDDNEEPEVEEVVARGDDWTIAEIRDPAWQGEGHARQETRYRIAIDPNRFSSPVELYSRATTIPYPKSVNTMIRVNKLGDWVCRTGGIASQIRTWASRQSDSQAAEKDYSGLARAIQESLPYDVHSWCAESLAHSVYRDQDLSYSELGRLLRTISDDRDNDVWGFVAVLMCHISIPGFKSSELTLPAS